MVQIEMSWVWIPVVSLLSLLATASLWRIWSKRPSSLPPGPTPWPIVGSMFLLRPPLHETFAKLSKKYGPVMLLKIGMMNTVVVGNAEMAKEVLKVRDVDFASRPHTAVFDVLSFNYNGLIGAPYGDAWKHIRRISTMHLFSPNKLNLSAKIRKGEIHTMVKRLLHATGEKQDHINFTALLHETVINSAFNLLFGKKHYQENQQAETNFVRLFLKSVLDEGFEFSIGDIIPPLKWLDMNGSERRFKEDLIPRITAFIQDLIADHKRKHEGSDDFQTQDFVDVLTRLQNGDALPDRTIIALLSDLLIGGTSTSEAAIDYAMADLIRHPQVLAKAQQEIDQVVGTDRIVEESDTANLPYLQAIVKETLRLHPGAPVGLPHYNPNPARIGPYEIPAKSTIFVNLWAIGRDPSAWDRANDFYPDRFINSEVNPLGQHFDFIPFGAGRRICVGYPLAMRFIPFALATLLQAFDWGPLPGKTIHDIDMSDTVGAGLHRAKDLLVSAAPRLSHFLLLSKQGVTMSKATYLTLHIKDKSICWFKRSGYDLQFFVSRFVSKLIY